MSLTVAADRPRRAFDRLAIIMDSQPPTERGLPALSIGGLRPRMQSFITVKIWSADGGCRAEVEHNQVAYVPAGLRFSLTYLRAS